MSPTLLTFLVVGALTAIIAGARTAASASRLGKLRRTPIARAGALPADGAVVRVIGTVRVLDGVTVAAPFSGRTGLVAVYELWETTRGTKVHRVDHQVVHAPFLVEDETGTVRVITDGLDTLLRMSEVRERDADSSAFGAGVVAANQTSASLREEAVLAPGDRVAVIGRVASGALVAPLVVSDHDALLR